jgi:putative SOS response-associated peptidase YedK
MCGRVYVKSTIADMVRRFSFANPARINALDNAFPLYNGAPTLSYPIIIVDEFALGSTMFVSGHWGFVTKTGGLVINARSETVATNGLFKRAYQQRRALMPIDGFFEWKDIFGTGKDKQPYAIAMKSGEPFALAAIWEMWHNAKTEEKIRTFCILTCEPNEMMATIHNRMPVILHPSDYMRWLTDTDPRDLLKPFPAELMTMWPINKKVGSPKNDTPDILDREEPLRTDLFE